MKIRPVNPKLNPGHPMARYCLGAWFFGANKTFVPDLSGYGRNAVYDVSSGPIDHVLTATEFGPATGVIGENPNGRLSLGSIPSDHPLTFAYSPSFIISMSHYRATAGPNSYRRIIDKSNGSSANNGWALNNGLNNDGQYEIWTSGAGFRLAAGGNRNVFGHSNFLMTVAQGFSWSDPLNEIWVNGERTKGGTSLGVADFPAVTTNMAFLQATYSTTIAAPGDIGHIVIYSLLQDSKVTGPAGRYFSDDMIYRLLDDPYEPFRPSNPIELFATPVTQPPSEFEPHRMHFATAS